MGAEDARETVGGRARAGPARSAGEKSGRGGKIGRAPGAEDEIILSSQPPYNHTNTHVCVCVCSAPTKPITSKTIQ